MIDIKFKCDKAINDLTYMMTKIDKSISYYEKNYKYLQNNNCKNMLNNKMENIINYINNILTVSIYDKTISCDIVTKNDLQNSYDNGNNIVIKFIDGEIKLRNLC